MSIEKVGPYVILEKLGSGGMGTVYLARTEDNPDAEPVALKVLSPSLSREAGFVQRFVREIESLQKLICPQVVRALDNGVDGDTYYYAMEYVEGETLTTRLRRERRIPWHETLEIAIQICSALKAAHDAGIIHRDLKPSNLMLTPDGEVKLTDFGVAQVFASHKLTQTGGIIGTAEYMSPEQAAGQRVTKKSDLYSLGAVMYAMLTGRPPFMGKSTLDVIQKHKFGQYDKPSRYVDGLPLPVEDVVQQLLEKEPDKRFPDAYVLSRKLQELLSRIDHTPPDQTVPGNLDGTERDTLDATVQTSPPVHAGEIGGTLMRDLVRAEIEGTAGDSTWSRFFNNTWVLLGLLVLLVGGGIAWMKYKPLSPDEVEPKLSDVELKLKEALQAIRVFKPLPAGPARRLQQQVELELSEGSVDMARQTLSALGAYIDGKDDYDSLRKKVERTKEALAGIKEKPVPPWQKLSNRAADLDEAGKHEDARAIRMTLVRLYESTDAAATVVEATREKLETSD